MTGPWSVFRVSEMLPWRLATSRVSVAVNGIGVLLRTDPVRMPVATVPDVDAVKVPEATGGGAYGGGSGTCAVKVPPQPPPGPLWASVSSAAVPQGLILSYVVEPVILLLVLGGGIGLLLWWGSRLPPTRPRPTSRHRGETLVDVHRRFKKRPPP